jgi:S-formylglutathione hydrolase
MTLTRVASNKSFGGCHHRYEHQSMVTKTRMRFAIYLPPQVEQGQQVPALYWLSGLTCTDENFMQKAGAHRIAAELGIAIIAPDTSPRGADVADDDGYDLGQGAGFYVNATEAPWAAHFQMYDYITDELPDLIEANFPVTKSRAICGHSMGGHGALMIALRNPEHYVSASAFSPISNPTACPWGKKALAAYLGDDEQAWRDYDSALLMAEAEQKVPMLVDQGLDDEFLKEQLHPEALEQAAQQNDYPLTLRMQEGYDHSYFFIASFIEEHLKFHFERLNQ